VFLLTFRKEMSTVTRTAVTGSLAIVAHFGTMLVHGLLLFYSPKLAGAEQAGDESDTGQTRFLHNDLPPGEWNKMERF
jgi:hypothetical protein